MSPNLEPTSNTPLFDQRNCIVRSLNWLEGLLLGPRFEQVQRSDGRWIYVPRLQSSDSGIQRPPWPELLIRPAGSTVAAALLGLAGLVPSPSAQVRNGISGFLLFAIVTGLYYGEQRSELLRIAQEQRSDAAAVAIRESIEEEGRKASQSAIFAGLAVLRTLSNSSDPTLKTAGRYFLTSLEDALPEDVAPKSDGDAGIDSEY